MATPSESLERAMHLPPGLCRSRSQRMVGGVAGGLAPYLGVDVLALRLAIVVLAAASGLGIVLYGVAWAVLPEEVEPPVVRPRTPDRMVGLALLTVGVVWLFGAAGLLLQPGIAWAVTLGCVGFALVWARTDGNDRTRGLLLRVAGGGLLLVLGFGVLFTSGGFLETLGQLGIAVLATGIGVALLLSPWILTLARDLGVERRERIRSEERSEIAAHLHDSVLQTLALIQRTDQPGRAKALARAQERELRAWLFDERPPDGDGGAARLGSALEAVVTEVEAEHDIEVDLVVVGDREITDPRLDALVAAVREATFNAARHAGVDDVSVFVEVADGSLTAFVRDRGVGFDPDAVEPGRMGLRESIVGRMARHGGTAEINSAPGEGTEVVLELERLPAKEPSR